MLRLSRYLRLAAHIASGALAVVLVFPFAGRALRQRMRQRWSRRMLRALGLRLQAEGEPIARGSLLVANHISWIDILVLNALQPAAFVSKAEVRAWPVIGWLAAHNDTVFLRRGSRGHAKIVNGEIGALLAAGHNVAVFPEGTTTDGSHVLHFHAALLQPAIECGHPVQPLALSYHRPDGRPSRAPAYDGDISFGDCLASVVAERALVARVEAAVPLPTPEGTARRTLAAEAHALIAAAVERTQHGGVLPAAAQPAGVSPAPEIPPHPRVAPR